jgi:uncharacterized protein (UPF0548 family)
MMNIANLPHAFSRCFVVLILLCNGCALVSSTSHFSSKDLDVCSRNVVHRSPFYAFRQRFMLRELGSHKHKKILGNSSISGTRFSLYHPNRQRVAAWFGGSANGAPEDCAQTVRNRVQLATHCNHPLAGMTNPTLQIDAQTAAAIPVSVPASRQTQRRKEDDATPSLSSIALSSARKSIPQWWPGIACKPDASWRVLRYRKTVGAGLDCYHACRDAALRWEFDGGSEGMVLVVTEPSSSRRDDDAAVYYRSPTQPASPSDVRRRGLSGMNDDSVLACSSLQQQQQSVQQIWWGPGRRLVTYTCTGLRWFPKLYTINPVTVIYDLVDQRGPGTTYTATAYATGQGHLLRGEERVTVCYRDTNEAVDVEILSYSKASDSLTGRLVWPLIGGMQRAFFQHQMKAFERVAADQSSRSHAPPRMDR